MASQNFTDLVVDAVLAHTLDLFRYDSGIRVKVLRLLDALKFETLQQLAMIDVENVGARIKRQRLEMVLSELEAIIKKYYRQMAEVSAEGLTGLSETETLFATKSVNTIAGVTILPAYKLTDSFVKALVSDVLIEGSPTKEWWARQATGTLERFKDQVRIGVGLGEANSKIIQRVLGNSTGRYKKVTLADGTVKSVAIYSGGMVETSRRNAESLVRSSVQAISNAARMTVYEENEDLILGYQALVVLDGKTSLICIGRSKAVWDVEGNPLEGVDYPMPGPPPWHWNCRTILIPILKSWQDLSGKIKRAPEGAIQASMDGQVAAELTFEKWMQSQSKEFQVKRLGKTRYQWWKEGKLDLKDLVDQYNRILTLDELMAKITA